MTQELHLDKENVDMSQKKYIALKADANDDFWTNKQEYALMVWKFNRMFRNMKSGDSKDKK